MVAKLTEQFHLFVPGEKSYTPTGGQACIPVGIKNPIKPRTSWRFIFIIFYLFIFKVISSPNTIQ